MFCLFYGLVINTPHPWVYKPDKEIKNEKFIILKDRLPYLSNCVSLEFMVPDSVIKEAVHHFSWFIDRPPDPTNFFSSSSCSYNLTILYVRWQESRWSINHVTSISRVNHKSGSYGALSGTLARWQNAPLTPAIIEVFFLFFFLLFIPRPCCRAVALMKVQSVVEGFLNPTRLLTLSVVCLLFLKGPKGAEN